MLSHAIIPMKDTMCETLKMRHYRTGRFGRP